MSDILSKDLALLGPFRFIVDLFGYISLLIPTTIEKLELLISLLSISPAPVCHNKRVLGQMWYEDVEKGCNFATYLIDTTIPHPSP